MMNESAQPQNIPSETPAPGDALDGPAEVLGRAPSPEERRILELLGAPGVAVGTLDPPSDANPGGTGAPEPPDVSPLEGLSDVDDPGSIVRQWLALPEWTQAMGVPERRDPVLPPLPPAAASVPQTAAGEPGDPDAPISAPTPAPPTPQRFLAVYEVRWPVGGALGNPRESGRRAAIAAGLRLTCCGAELRGILEQPRGSEPGGPEAAEAAEAFRWGWKEACAAFRLQWVQGEWPIQGAGGAPDGPGIPGRVALVGMVDAADHRIPAGFRQAGDAILLLGNGVDPEDPLQGLGGSAYGQHRSLPRSALPPAVSWEKAATLHTTLRGLIHEGVVRSALDCSRGGLAVCLVECCVASVPAAESGNPLGAQVEFPAAAEDGTPVPRVDARLFGESPHRVVLTVAAMDSGRVLKQCRILGVPAVRLGTVGGEALVVKAGSLELNLPVAELPRR